VLRPGATPFGLLTFLDDSGNMTRVVWKAGRAAFIRKMKGGGDRREMDLDEVSHKAILKLCWGESQRVRDASAIHRMCKVLVRRRIVPAGVMR
jgi:hypothetical protein